MFMRNEGYDLKKLDSNVLNTYKEYDDFGIQSLLFAESFI